MAKTHRIKSVIQSTEKTAQITRAMQFVAASRLPQAKQRLDQAAPFSDVIEKIIFGYALDEASHHPYFKHAERSHQYGVIIITSDRGLCGNLNLALYKQFLSHSKEWTKKGVSPLLSVYGKKGIKFFSEHAKILSSTSGLGESPSVADLMSLISPMLDAYQKGEVDKVFILSNKHVNTLVQQPQLKQVLPIVPPKDFPKHVGSYIYEPTKSDVITPLLKQYIESSIYRAVIENIACEQASRMIAMKNATESAQNIISELNLTYNKARQAIITQEIAEIAAGSSTD